MTNPAIDIPPIAVLTGPTKGDVGKPLHFSAAGSRAQITGTWVTKYEWYVTTQERNYWKSYTGKDINITFDTIGEYNISLQVSDNRQLNGVAYTNVTITNPAEAHLFPVPIIVGPRKGLINETLNYTAAFSKVRINGSWLVNFTWDFGDGNRTYGVEVNHTYGTARNYTLNLTIKDNMGRTNSTNITIRITTEPIVEPPPTTPGQNGTSDKLIGNILKGGVVLLIVIIVIAALIPKRTTAKATKAVAVKPKASKKKVTKAEEE